MNSASPPPDELFLNVRRAYRLLHDYQQMVLDAIRYIGGQLDIEDNGGMAVFGGDALRSGERRLAMASWDYLPMVLCEFHFWKGPSDQCLSLSFFVVSDTGYFQSNSNQAEKGRTQTYETAEKSQTKLLVLLRPGHFDPRLFKEESEARTFFVEGQISKFREGERWVCRAFNMDQILNEPSANVIVEAILELAKTKGFDLRRNTHL